MNTEITKEKLDKYFAITGKALNMVKSHEMDVERMSMAQDFLNMAQSYFTDARHFADEKEDWVLAYGALNYAHAWLDAGARIGLFKVKDDQLFTVDVN